MYMRINHYYHPHCACSQILGNPAYVSFMTTDKELYYWSGDDDAILSVLLGTKGIITIQ